jgi:hypothetical protein
MQEVAGSSPASSTHRTPADAGVLSYEREAQLTLLDDDATLFGRVKIGLEPGGVLR